MRIAVDVDDVIGAFYPDLCRYYNEPIEIIDHWNEKEMNKKFGKGWFNPVKKDEDFWLNMTVLNSIPFKAYCYISSFPKQMYEQRIKWIKNNNLPNIPLYWTNNKVQMCKDLSIDILVDDKPQTIKDLKGTGVLGLHYKSFYSDCPDTGEVITDLKEVKNYARR